MTDNKQDLRLDNRILQALKLALDQKDIEIAEMLTRALELAMTRDAGGAVFKERREMSPEAQQALARFAELRRGAK